MTDSVDLISLPAELEAIFSAHEHDHVALMKAFMPALCHHLRADRIFLQPRNPDTRICQIIMWRRDEEIPWPAIPGQSSGKWFIEDKWEIEDPLWRAALQLKPTIYIEDPEKAAQDGLLSLAFENSYMFHTAFIHGHAHWPPLPRSGPDSDSAAGQRKFYGSVQPAVFDGPRIWSDEDRDLMERCLVRIAPIMKAFGETAPSPLSLKQN